MEKFQEAKLKAKTNIANADHMLNVTYKLVRDTKLLLAVMDNIFLALTNSMGAILYYDYLFKRVPSFQETFDSKFNLFRAKSMIKHNIPNIYTKLIQDVKNIILQHKKSPVEFIRKDQIVICSENYQMQVIDLNKIKDYIYKTKTFVQLMDKIVSKNEHIFR